LLIDPDEAEEISNAMLSCLNEGICKQLVQCGRVRLAEIQKDREKAEIEFLSKLMQFEKRLQCWNPAS
jgi:hypothetical protein